MSTTLDTIERRRVPRRSPDPKEPLSRVRLRGGRELAVHDISPAGVLLEGEGRLLPGTHVDIHLTTRHGRVLVRGRVMRASVWQLSADRVDYRSAISFDVTVDTTTHGYGVPADAASERPAYPGSDGVTDHTS